MYFLLQCCCGYCYCKCWKQSRSGYHPLSQNTTSDPASEATTPETIVNLDGDDITQSIGSTSSHSQGKKTPERGKSPAREISPDHTNTDRNSGGSFQKRTVERTEQERRERGMYICIVIEVIKYYYTIQKRLIVWFKVFFKKTIKCMEESHNFLISVRQQSQVEISSIFFK